MSYMVEAYVALAALYLGYLVYLRSQARQSREVRSRGRAR